MCVWTYNIHRFCIFLCRFCVLAPRLWPLAATKRGDLTCRCGGACACEARRFGRKIWGGFPRVKAPRGVIFLSLSWKASFFLSIFVLASDFSKLWRVCVYSIFFRYLGWNLWSLFSSHVMEQIVISRSVLDFTWRAGVRWPFVQMRVKWQDTWKRPWGWGVLNLRNGIPCLPEVMLLGLT